MAYSQGPLPRLRDTQQQVSIASCNASAQAEPAWRTQSQGFGAQRTSGVTEQHASTSLQPPQQAPSQPPAPSQPSYIVARPDQASTVLTFKPESPTSRTSSLSGPGSSNSPPPHSLLSHPPQPPNAYWPTQQSSLFSKSNSVSNAYLEARRAVAMRASTASESKNSVGESDGGSSGSDDEHKQVTKLLLAAVLSSERSKAQHSRHHSWSARHSDGYHAPARARPPSRLSTDLPPAPHTLPQGTGDGSAHGSPPARVRSSYHLRQGQAAVELFLRLSHARQTVDFAKRQAFVFSSGSRGMMDVWEALELLNELREFEAVLLRSSDTGEEAPGGDPRGGERGAGAGEARGEAAGVGPAAVDMTLMEHALQTAELCRLHFGPEKDYMHLVGLIHGLGKLLAHRRFGTQPQWAVCGESFPCGCRFAPGIQGSQYFSANSDRRRRVYNTPCGMYTPHCGLTHVTMSWGAAEYLHQVLQRNHCRLPPEAMFCIRFQKFFTLIDGSYNHLLDANDQAMLPTLAAFQPLCEFRRRTLPDTAMRDATQTHEYYNALIAKYLPDKLQW